MATQILRQNPLHSNAVNQLSMAAENFLHRLMNAVDRYGCFDGRIAMLRAMLYPLKVDEVKPEQISEWLTECVTLGLIKCYEVNGEAYLELQGFKCRSVQIKTIIPQPPQQQNAPDVPATETPENPVQENEAQITATPLAVETTPLTADKQHEHFLKELFKRENEVYLTA